MYRKILVPVDGSPTSTAGLAEAIRLAASLHATLRLVHVVEDFGLGPGAEAVVYLGGSLDLIRESGKQVLAQAQAQARAAGLTPESVMRETAGGRAAALIVEEAVTWGADLIVLGTHGRRGVERLIMGSDAEDIVRTAPAPILLVRSQS